MGHCTAIVVKSGTSTGSSTSTSTQTLQCGLNGSPAYCTEIVVELILLYTSTCTGTSRNQTSLCGLNRSPAHGAILQLHFIQSPFPNQFRFGLDKTFLSQFSGTVNGKSQLCIFV